MRGNLKLFELKKRIEKKSNEKYIDYFKLTW